MALDKKITVEVAYAKRDQQTLLTLEIEAGATIEQAIHQSGILKIFPEIDLTANKVGIFGVLKKLTDILKTGDRVEIYRSLIMNPKEARRVRAKRSN